MKNLNYLFVISLFALSCSDCDSNNENNIKTDVGIDVSDDVPADTGGSNNNDMTSCIPFLPDESDPDDCIGEFSCSDVDDLCGSTVEECSCSCVQDGGCGIEGIGTANCMDNTCSYASDEIEAVLQKAKNIIFVRSGGPGGKGTKVDPFGSFDEAMQQAGVDDVVLIRGDLNEQLLLKDGVHVLGGRNSAWQAGENRSKIAPGTNLMKPGFPWAAIVAQDIDKTVVLHRMELTTPNAEVGSSYGFFAFNSSVEFLDVRAFAGNGAAGTDGIPGGAGEVGVLGSSPVNHENSYITTIQFPNVETVNINCPADTEGGYGGKGSVRGIRPTNGEKGSPLSIGGGNGGFAAETSVSLVGPGADSLFVVPDGVDAVGGLSEGDILGTGWLPTGVGSAGEAGENGRGGGGGGGADFVNSSPQYHGPNGANGGSGGCGGKGGTGGSPGGASIGIYSVNSALILNSSDFSASVGGEGGAGGSGGLGGNGGNGGTGSIQRCWGAGVGECVADSNFFDIPSGNGGRGGKGGKGGSGGGGAGGISHGGLCSNSSVTISNSFFTKGIGGAEGAPNGAMGTSLNQEGCE